MIRKCLSCGWDDVEEQWGIRTVQCEIERVPYPCIGSIIQFALYEVVRTRRFKQDGDKQCVTYTLYTRAAVSQIT